MRMRVARCSPFSPLACDLSGLSFGIAWKAIMKRLDGWVRESRERAPPEMAQSTHGIVADREAVEAGLTDRPASGQTEEQVSRLESLRDCLYGHGKLDLPRKRLTPGRRMGSKIVSLKRMEVNNPMVGRI